MAMRSNTGTFKLTAHMPVISLPTHGYLTITFPDIGLANSYYWIVEYALVKSGNANLDVILEGRNVSFRLLSRLKEIEINNLGAHGVWFTFSDEASAKQWEEDLVLWTSSESDPCKLFISA